MNLRIHHSELMNESYTKSSQHSAFVHENVSDPYPKFAHVYI